MLYPAELRAQARLQYVAERSGKSSANHSPSPLEIAETARIHNETIFFAADEQNRDELRILVEYPQLIPFSADELLRIHAGKRTFNGANRGMISPKLPTINELRPRLGRLENT